MSLRRRGWGLLGTAVHHHIRLSEFAVSLVHVVGCELGNCAPQIRTYTTLGHGIFQPKQYTKYRIATDFSPTSDYEDLYLAEPSRDDFVRTTKDEPILLRFLKLVTDQEGRPEAFKAFARRCEAGLVVEKDVFVTKGELMEALWENGYSELELNAYEIAFPADYHFHYPELAVLFDSKEEDCYKYCLRKRAESPDGLVELKAKPVPSKIASYGLLSVVAWFGLQNNMLGNIWMFVKTWPFMAVFYMLASHFQKSIAGKFFSDAAVESYVSNENRLQGEDRVYEQMKKYSNDSLCLDYLESFKPAIERQLAEYRQAALLQIRERMIEGMTQHLLAVQQAERAIESSLQKIIVHETFKLFHETFSTEQALHTASFDAAIEAIGRTDEARVSDPVGEFFRKSLDQLVLKNAASEDGLVQRVNDVFEAQERDFLNQFSVTQREANEVATLRKKAIEKAGVCVVTGLPRLDRLAPEDLLPMEDLYKKVMTKVGLKSLLLAFAFQLPSSVKSVDSTCQDFLDKVATRVKEEHARLRQVQLQSFMQSLA